MTRMELIRLLGGQSEAARILGVTRAAMCKWWRRTAQEPVPLRHIPALERHGLSRHDVRPDVYPPDDACRCITCLRQELERRRAERASRMRRYRRRVA